MEINKGDCVQVNLAPFIGSLRRSKTSIPCEIISADATHVEIRTAPPYREVSLRVPIAWVEESSQ